MKLQSSPYIHPTLTPAKAPAQGLKWTNPLPARLPTQTRKLKEPREETSSRTKLLDFPEIIFLIIFLTTTNLKAQHDEEKIEHQEPMHITIDENRFRALETPVAGPGSRVRGARGFLLL